MQTTNTAQQGPSSTTPLTIHTNRLGDLWLPEEKSTREALDYISTLCRKNVGTTNHPHLIAARSALRNDHSFVVKTITERGGLLLIGGAA